MGNSPDIRKNKGEPQKKTFQIITKSQEFSAVLYSYLAKSEKEYRSSICQKVQEYSLNVIHCARMANSYELHDEGREKAHKKTMEFMNRIEDLLPVLRRLKCITDEQESDLMRRLNALKNGYSRWIESDAKRLDQSGV